MRASRTAALVALVLLAAPAAVRAQRAIYGSVRGTNHRDVVPPTFSVKVTAVDVSTNTPVAWDIFTGPVFGMSVENNRTVRLIFESDGYAPYTVPRISTGTERTGYKVPPVPVVLTRIYGRSLTKTQVADELRKSRVVTKITGAVDVFLYNLEVYKQGYRDNPDILSEIERFKTETKASEEFRDLLTPERETRMNNFGEIIRFRSRTISSLNPAKALELFKDEALFPGIRAQAAQAFTDSAERAPDLTAQALEYFRAQATAPDSTLLAPSYTALLSIGAEQDVSMVLGKVGSDDFDQSVAAAAAIGEAGLTRGTAVLSELVKPEAATDPALRLVASNSLKKLSVRGQDSAAASILATVLAKDDDAAVRAEAAEGLAGAPRSNFTFGVLRQASVNDDSYDVRVAAAGAAVKNTSATVPRPRPRL